MSTACPSQRLADPLKIEARESLNREPWFETVRIVMTTPHGVNLILPFCIAAPPRCSKHTILVLVLSWTKPTVRVDPKTTVRRYRNCQKVSLPRA
jgi:hypothetical protein